MADKKLIEILTAVEPGVDYQNQKDLVTSHILTSIDIVRIVIEIENKYGITFSPIDIVPENFDSADSIQLLINKTLEEQ